MAENVNGSYKNELIHTHTWSDVVDVEIATFAWVNWWNETRLHQGLGYQTPTKNRNQVLETKQVITDNRKQGKYLGTKPGTLHPDFPIYSNGRKPRPFHIGGRYFEIAKDHLAHGSRQDAVNNNDLKGVHLAVPGISPLEECHEATHASYQQTCWY